MGLQPTKECVECGVHQPRGWTENRTFTCDTCKSKAAARAIGYRVQNDLRSDPTRRSLHNHGDDLDPLNPLSLTSPLNPVYHVNDRNDWDDSSHRHHSGSSHHSSHDDGGSYDSGSSDSGSSGGSSD